MFGGDKSKTRRVASLQSDVAALEAALESARAEYNRVLERNMQARPHCGIRKSLEGCGDGACGSVADDNWYLIEGAGLR